MPRHQIEFLGTLDVLTVRQFAVMHRDEVLAFDDELAARHILAVESTQLHPEKVQKAIKEEPTFVAWGYMYMPASEFNLIIEHHEIRSAYTLFQDYTNCAPEKRFDHAWKTLVYFKHLYRASDALRRNNARAGVAQQGEVILSDADVFSFLLWEHVHTIAKLDVTAAARAVYFYWSLIPLSVHRDLVAIDEVEGHPYRNGFRMRINLTRLCHVYGGKLFSRYSVEGEKREIEHWREVNLENSAQEQLYHDRTKDCGYYASPTGSIVLPDGVVPSDCMSTHRSELTAENLYGI